MKTLALLLIAFMCAVPLRADSWLDNSDFTDGLNHWRGNGRSPADVTSDNPMDKPDPLLSKGLILPLRGRDWDKIEQDFHGKSTAGVLTIVYQMAPDVTFSTNEEDYMNIPDQLHFEGWKTFRVPPGSWIVFIADMGSSRGTYYPIQPKLGVAGPQSLRVRVKDLTPLEDKTITVAFPPGSGNVVLLNVSLTDQ
jgi:hypothetical protein